MTPLQTPRLVGVPVSITCVSVAVRVMFGGRTPVRKKTVTGSTALSIFTTTLYGDFTIPGGMRKRGKGSLIPGSVVAVITVRSSISWFSVLPIGDVKPNEKWSS